MFIVWGKKYQARSHGFAGAFCIVCRAVTAWKVRRTQLVGHLYYLPTGPGTHAFDDITCTQCGMQQRLAPGALRPCDDQGCNPLGLAAQTTADRAASVVARLALEERLRKGELSAAERADLIAEAFTQLDFLLRIKCERGVHRSVASVLIFLLLILTAITGSMWVVALQPGFVSPPYFMLALGAGTLITVAVACLVVRGALTHKRRVAARYVNDRLARALGALRPTPEELEAALGALRKQRVSLARVVSVRALRDAIALLPAGPSREVTRAA